MLRGRSTQITGQIGEYLVAAELCRRGFFSTTFTVNIPHYDIIASENTGKHIPIQVKAINSGSWQLNMKKFCDVQIENAKVSRPGSFTPAPLRTVREPLGSYRSRHPSLKA